jgi:hypothetical protein
VTDCVLIGTISWNGGAMGRRFIQALRGSRALAGLLGGLVVAAVLAGPGAWAAITGPGSYGFDKSIPSGTSQGYQVGDLDLAFSCDGTTHFSVAGVGTAGRFTWIYTDFSTQTARARSFAVPSGGLVTVSIGLAQVTGTYIWQDASGVETGTISWREFPSGQHCNYAGSVDQAPNLS